MTNELKPCPFQKEGEVHELELVDVGALKWVRCKTCNAQGPCDPSKQKAMDLWNTRYKRTCRNVYKENRHVMDQCDNGFECSECGNVIEDYEHYGVKGTFNVCPNCGAEVADAD